MLTHINNKVLKPQQEIREDQMNKKITSYLSLCILSALHGSVVASEEGADQIVSEKQMETIEIKGIRGSLVKALNTKRFSDSVIDSISAEDIGDFPDKNIGDALQRIPGVTVSRSYGEVDGVTIRGTAPQHSMLLLNGQNVASVGWFDNDPFRRSFNFEMVSAEQVAGLDVYKSVESHNNEGALGGTIDLKTRKPFDLAANTFFGSVENSYSETADEWSPAYSGLYSFKNENENFGVLIAHSSEEQSVVRESLSTFGNSGVWNFPGVTVQDSNGEFPVVPLGFASIIFDEKRKRESSQLTFQYQINDNFNVALDYNRFALKNTHTNTALFGFLHHNAVIDADTMRVNNNGVTTGGTVSAISQDSDLVPLFNNTLLRKPEMISDVINLTLHYESDDWSIEGVIGQSEAESRGLQTSTWWGNQTDKSTTGFTFDVDGPLELIPTHPDMLTDHSQQSLYQEFSYLNNVRDNDINYYQIDGSYNLEKGIFTTVEAGIKLQEQYFGASQHYFDNGILAQGMADGLTMADFNGGVVSGLHGKEGRSGTLSSFAVINGGIWDYAKQHKGELQIRNQFSIDEEITSAYIKGNFSGEYFRGNVGLRVVETDVESNGSSDGTPQGETLKGEKTYTNYLPSVNIAADVSDDVLFRFAAGSTVSRPDYAQMQMLTTIQIHQGLAQVGSPDIEPYKSDQYDLGLEWYFNESSLISSTLFQKNISDYIEQTTATEQLEGCGTCSVTRYRNAGTAKVSGIELQYQQNFENGFGLQANYTYTDSELVRANGELAPMEGVSENSFNLAGYFENDMFSARIAYNARDEFEQSYNGITGMADSFSQVDASIVWHAMSNLDISIEAVNLFNEARVIQLPEHGITHAVDEFGARYFVGASVKF